MFASNKWSPLNVCSSQSKFDCVEWREEGWPGHSCKQWRKRNICYDTDKAKMIIACKCWQMQQSSLLSRTLKSPRRVMTLTLACTLLYYCCQFAVMSGNECSFSKHCCPLNVQYSEITMTYRTAGKANYDYSLPVLNLIQNQLS